MKRTGIRIICVIFILAMCISSTALAAETKASDYIKSYSAATTTTGSSNVRIGFSITGKSIMDKIGVTTIYLYEKPQGSNSWTIVKVFTNADFPSLVAENTSSHSGNVSYSGTSGCQYYAVVYFRAEKGSGSDSRAYTTSVATAQFAKSR